MSRKVRCRDDRDLLGRLLKNERGNYPAYSWFVKHFEGIGRLDCAAELFARAESVSTECGAYGMAQFDSALRRSLSEFLMPAGGSRG